MSTPLLTSRPSTLVLSTNSWAINKNTLSKQINKHTREQTNKQGKGWNNFECVHLLLSGVREDSNVSWREFQWKKLEHGWDLGSTQCCHWVNTFFAKDAITHVLLIVVLSFRCSGRGGLLLLKWNWVVLVAIDGPHTLQQQLFNDGPHHLSILFLERQLSLFWAFQQQQWQWHMQASILGVLKEKEGLAQKVLARWQHCVGPSLRIYLISCHKLKMH